MKLLASMACFLSFALLANTSLQAQVLHIPLSQQGSTRIKMPMHGDKQTQVIEQFGEPTRRHASVGQPPITRWDYPSFSVYFEHSTVVNSVQIHQPSASTAP